MKINCSQAGTLESGDIMIQIFPAEHPGLEINLESTVAYQFGEQIKNVIKETVGELGVTDARARTTAAVVRATGVDVWQD